MLNAKFKHNKAPFIFQTLLVTLITFVVVIALGNVSQAVILGAIGASSLGASTFISFSMPDSPAAEPWHMIFSYLIGLITGVLFFCICHYFGHIQHLLSADTVFEVGAALAVGCTMLLMVLLNVEHPPAAGLALGIVLDQWSFWTLVVIFLTAVMITLLKEFLRPWLTPLIQGSK